MPLIGDIPFEQCVGGGDGSRYIVVVYLVWVAYQDDLLFVGGCSPSESALN